MSTTAQSKQPGPADRTIETRVEALDWASVSTHLDANGWAMIDALLTDGECHEIADLYVNDGIFRSRVVMARHGFGRGEYKYFAYPLPDIVAICAMLSIRNSRRLPIAGMLRWASTFATRTHTPTLSSAVTRQVKSVPHRFFSNTVRGTITLCTRTYTASMFFRCRLRFSCLSQAKTSLVASSC